MSVDFPTVRLNPKAQRRVLRGHPWVYSNELDMEGLRELAPGSLVRLRADSGRLLGTAIFNRHTLIAARLLTRDPEAPIDAAFFAERLARAKEIRERRFPLPYYRLVHAEADGFPGLVVDRFGDTVVLQVNTAGLERLRAALLEALDAVVAPATIVLRNDSPARQLERLERYVELVRGRLEGPLELEENGTRFLADPRAGQKTGWFYDQRDNRAWLAPVAAGARVFDGYCYSGGFAVQMARAGAEQVLGVDRSQPALALAEGAARIGGVEQRCRFVKGAVFTQMERLSEQGERFGLVIVDPPAFVKSKKELAQGARGYRKMTRLAATLVAPGGYLFVASCSHHVDAPLFAEQVARGLSDAGRFGRILRASGAASDHPVHPFLPESAYLKALALALD